MNIQELIEAVRQWGLDRNITGPNGKGTLLGQLAKTEEELDETIDAAKQWRCGLRHDDEDEAANGMANLIDGLGDITVTVILAAEMAGLRFEDCLAAAYDEIKGRTGKMEGGVFVKDKP
jgi:NTP pyrophosphatase (non-canonical NTP hydrolase)